MVVLTPSALVERLRAVYGVKTDNELSHKLNEDVRQIARWKNDSGPNFWTTVDLLNRAGWLHVSETLPTAEHLSEAQRYADEARAAARRLAQQLPDAQSTDA